MSHDPRPAPAERRGLFPSGVVMMEMDGPGDVSRLLPEEAESVRRAVRKRVEEFAAGRACARSALAVLGIRDFALCSAVDRQPVWPPGIVGTITHTAGFCAAAVAPGSELEGIGLDSEIVGAPTTEIWSTICREEELAWVKRLPTAEQPAAVTLLFSAKESFYKCQYPLVGEWLNFSDVTVRVDGWGKAGGTFLVDATRSIEFAALARLPIAGRYVFHGNFVSAAVSLAAAGHVSPGPRPNPLESQAIQE